MAGWRQGAVVAAAALGLAGCGGGELDSPTDATNVTPASIVGVTWRLTSLNGQPVLGGTTVTAEFSIEARVAGSAGCNRYMGTARAETGGRLAVGPLASTLMACSPQGVMDQETRYLATLQAATSFALNGDELRLGPMGGATTLVYSSR
jgi:heat shock protein HslJ